MRSEITTTMLWCLVGRSRPRTMLSGTRARMAATPTTAFTLRVPSEDTMAALGAAVAEASSAGDTICLSGDLGAGKTTFARGFIRARCRDARMRVTSPSYLLDVSYETGDGEGGVSSPVIHHMDLQRLGADADLKELGLDVVLREDAQEICLVEWPDRMGVKYTPTERLEVEIRIEDPRCDMRVAHLTPHGAGWQTRVGRIPFDIGDGGG